MIKEVTGLREILKKSGCKTTPARTQIFELLKKAEKPLSVKDIQVRLKNIDPVTIYRTLLQFEKLGLISKPALARDRAYFEYAPIHHHHIVCTGCGVIEELSDCAIPKSKLLGMKTGKFPEVSRHSLEFFGTCFACYDSR